MIKRKNIWGLRTAEESGKVEKYLVQTQDLD